GSGGSGSGGSGSGGSGSGGSGSGDSGSGDSDTGGSRDTNTVPTRSGGGTMFWLEFLFLAGLYARRKTFTKINF
ncbi:MAG TPA: GlyGly-CTERM sorting domain-containing protein, partial [Leucothrix mucor]|nr:GlyGly-CTERM sorting domain-containing protein [Leucothrix mucor]